MPPTTAAPPSSSARWAGSGCGRSSRLRVRKPRSAVSNPRPATSATAVEAGQPGEPSLSTCDDEGGGEGWWWCRGCSIANEPPEATRVQHKKTGPTRWHGLARGWWEGQGMGGGGGGSSNKQRNDQDQGVPDGATKHSPRKHPTHTYPSQQLLLCLRGQLGLPLRRAAAGVLGHLPACAAGCSSC
jgi:hypothetical protein